MTTEIVGLGFAAMDLFLSTEELPKEDGFSFIHAEHLLPGGSCANAMVALSRLQASAALIATVGDDHYGNLFLQDLEESGVSSRYLLIRPGGTTLHNFITVTRSGAKAIFSNLGDSLLSLTEEEVSPDMLSGAKVFYNEMIPGKPALKLARACREMQIPIVFNLQVGPQFMHLCGVPLTEIKEMLTLCDLFVCNQHTLLELAGEDDCFHAASRIGQAHRPSLGMVTTMGKKGALYMTNNESFLIPAPPIQPVDTTGAGDAFSAGLIYATFIKGLGMKSSLQFATACAALKCTQAGPRLQADEALILRFMQGHERQ